jgi:hypothetical protein
VAAAAVRSWPPSAGACRLLCLAMAEIVLRVPLIGSDHFEVTYEDPHAVDTDVVTEHAIVAPPNTPVPFAPDMVTGLSCCTAAALLPPRSHRAAVV